MAKKIIDGVVYDLSDEEIAVRNAQIAEIATEEAANGYKRQRAKEYPTWQEQMDDIYHNGIDGWKATIKSTKDKYPKPS